jgi:hypothetical protein
MRKLDWFLAAIVASFLLAVVVIETASVSIGAVSWGVAHADGVAEVTMRHLVTRLPHPDITTFDPR